MQLVVKVWRHVWRGSDNDENEAGRSLKKRSWGNGSVYYSSVRVNIVILLENTRVKLQDITLASCQVGEEEKNDEISLQKENWIHWMDQKIRQR